MPTDPIRSSRAFRTSADGYLSSLGGTLDKKAMDKARKRFADLERRLTQALDPRGFKVHPISAPDETERLHPWMWRF